MEISGKGPGMRIEAYITNTKGKEPVGATEPVAAVRPAQGDKVELSPRAREIQEAKRQVAELPDIRSEKVDQLRQALETGTYEVKGGQVAMKMIRQSIIDELL